MPSIRRVGLLDRLYARLPDRPAVVRTCAMIVAGAIAIWAVGLAVTLLLAVLAGGVALAAAIAAIALGGTLLARRKPEVDKAPAGDIVKRQPDGCPL